MIWTFFIGMVLIFIGIDLGVFNRRPHVIGIKESSIWTSIWVGLALSFSLAVYYIYSKSLIENPTALIPFDAAITYITGYLIELSLSVDNIFVIAVIFSSFEIPLKYQHRVLFWGIVGAIIFRGLMIIFGVALITYFSWMIYVFGIFLLYTAYTMLKEKGKEFNPRTSAAFRIVRSLMPITREVQGQKFFVRKKHILAATPLFVALLVIEVTDILFALDSIPAVLAITSDPFLVFSSNIFAILGLRSMYFFISHMLNKFAFIHYSLISILTFVGLKMIVSHLIHIPQWLSLGFIILALFMGVIISVRRDRKSKKAPYNEN